MDSTKLNNRILTLINHLSITSAAFADEIGVQRSAIAHITKGRNRPSLDMIQKILDRYPDVNVMWLLRGEGNIMSSTPNVISLQQRNVMPSTPVIDNSLQNTLFAEEENSSEKDVIEQVKTEPIPSPIHTTPLPQSQPRSYSVDDFEEKTEDESREIKKERTASVESILPPSVKKDKKISRIIVFYDDNSYEELSK